MALATIPDRRPMALPAWLARVGARALPLLLALLVGALGAFPRLAAVGLPVTADESAWFRNTTQFAAALLAEDWRGTFQIGHPGVTTMWIGALGMGGLKEARAVRGRPKLLERSNLEAFVGARQAMALANTALLGALVLVATRLVGAGAAALAGLLLAFDPWLVGHSRLLHLDALLSGLMALCLLAALARWQRQGSFWFVLLAGLAAGLAVLTKTAALALLPPLVLLLALARVWQDRGGRSWLARVGELAAMGVVAGVAMLLLWPALLADPIEIAVRVVEFSEETGGGAHENFFLGQPTPNPGLAYYPAVLAFRLSPFVALGALLWLATILRERRSLGALAREPALWLLVCAALVVLIMGLGPKKQDRYVLPAIPLLAVVAALGYQRALSGLRGHAALPALAVAAVGLGQLLLCADSRPYYLTYYSPLLGGAQVAQRVILVGWGEGLDPVAAYLNTLPKSPRPTVAGPDTTNAALQAQTRARVVGRGERKRERDYVVSYINAEQRHIGVPLDRAAQPVLSVRIDGVEYAALYRLPPR